jgi:large subunit ribosomal protein L25
MAEIVLAAETGRSTGSRSSNRLRAEGKIPGVLYGHGGDSLSVAVDRRELRHALTTEAGLNALINLEIAGDRQLTIVKDLQRDPVRRNVTHVDFLRISRDVAITVEVPIVLYGEAEEVARAEGLVDQVLHQLTVTAKPGDIPGEISVDVSALTLGDSVRVGDLTLPDGVTVEVDAEEPVVTTTVAAIELPEPEVAEGEEEEAEAAEGAEEGAGGGEGAAGDQSSGGEG